MQAATEDFVRRPRTNPAAKPSQCTSRVISPSGSAAKETPGGFGSVCSEHCQIQFSLCTSSSKYQPSRQRCPDRSTHAKESLNASGGWLLQGFTSSNPEALVSQ